MARTVEGINLSQVKNKSQTVTNTAMNNGVPNAYIFGLSEEI